MMNSVTFSASCSGSRRPPGRYHSLIAEPEALPDVLEVSARTDEGEIMAVRHRTLAVEGVQFHPESVLTPQGPALMENFLRQRSATR